MSNSAHDPITVLKDATREDIKDEIQFKVYELVKRMQENEEKGAAVFLQHTLTFEVTIGSKAHSIDFVVDDIIKPNWLSFLPQDPTTTLTDADFKALDAGQFSISVGDTVAPYTRMSYRELFEFMDDYKAGRPSSVSNIFKQLRESSELIFADIDTNQITLTEKGKTVLEEIRAQFGDLASPAWNNRFINQLEAIDRGAKTADTVLKSLFIELFGKHNLHHIEGLIWTDPNILYAPAPLTETTSGARLAPDLPVKGSYIKVGTSPEQIAYKVGDQSSTAKDLPFLPAQFTKVGKQ